jgi:hypothetical protein
VCPLSASSRRRLPSDLSVLGWSGMPDELVTIPMTSQEDIITWVSGGGEKGLCYCRKMTSFHWIKFEIF